jgi:MFS family permease
LKVSDGSPVAPPNLSARQTSVSALLSRVAALDLKNDNLIAFGLFILCFATRFIAIPASLWEYDDILFARALHKFDLTTHSPHPPGFPIFVAMTRAVFWLVGNEHRALTTVAFIFASLVAPALYYLYRVVLEDRRIAIAGALLGSFAPNVWVHSGAGRSDGVAFSLGIIGLALVLRGIQSPRLLIAGCAVFGLAFGVRTSVLPVMGPAIALVFLIRLRRRQWRSVIAALAVGTFCVLIWFVPTVYHHTWPVYSRAVDYQSRYIFETDTIFIEAKSLKLFFYRFRRFFEHIWGTRWIMYLVYVFAVTGLIALAVNRKWKNIGLMVIIFLPYLIFTFMLNTRLNGPLYSLPYVPLFTGLAACGLIWAPRWLFRSGRHEALKNSGLFLAICLTVVIAAWTYPIIGLLHREVSPPVRAFNHLKKTLDQKNDLLLYGSIYRPFVSFYLPDHRTALFDEILDPWSNMIWSPAELPRILTLTADPILGMDSDHFIWTSSEVGAKRLIKPGLERFLGVHITDRPKPQGIAFLSGWYPIEIDQEEIRRWMRLQSKVALYSLADSMTLRLRGSIVDLPDPDRRPTLVFKLNGAEIDRFIFTGSDIDHQLTIKPDPSLTWSILSLEIDQRVDTTSRNEYGLKCFGIEWKPSPGATLIETSPIKYLGSGWQKLENDGTRYWRWTSGTSITHLPAIAGNGRIFLNMFVPEQSDESKREIKIEVAGTLIEQFHPPNRSIIKTIEVPASLHRNAQLEMKLSLPNDDAKSNAIQIFFLGWQPSEKN